MRSSLASRRRTETALIALSGVVVTAAFAVAAIGIEDNGDSSWGDSGWGDGMWTAWGWLVALLGAITLAHLAIRRWAPAANELLFGIVALLVNLGWVMVVRIDPKLAVSHTIGVLAGFAALTITLVAYGRIERVLTRPGTLAAAAVVLIGLGLTGTGADVSAGAYEPARQWLNVGTLSIQPYGIAKILLVLAACGVTVSAPRRLAMGLVPHRHVIGAIIAAVGSWALLLVSRDFGSAVLLFLVVWMTLWLDDNPGQPTTARALGGTAAAFGVGVVVLATVYDPLGVQLRRWQSPSPDASTMQSAFAIADGGVSGVGLGLGDPGRIIAAHSDFVLIVVAEELGILGASAVLAAFVLLAGVGAAIAQSAGGVRRLLAAALTFCIGLQALFSTAGMLRLVPHTVGAMPFVAHGPVAMVGSLAAVGMLLAISDAAAGSAPAPKPRRSGPRRVDATTTIEIEAPK